MKKFYLVFIIFSLVFVGLGTYGIFKPEEKYEETIGTIVRIEEGYSTSDDGITYTPYINYKVNNKEYKDVQYGAYNSSMKVGDEVKVYYLFDDPTYIQAEGYKNVPYIVLGISLIFLSISIFLFIKK